MPDSSALPVTAVILAGGMGRRMNDDDKGLVEFRGKPLVAHALARIAPQVQEVLISANRNLERYAEFAVPVVPDATSDYAGPLAGLAAALAQARCPLVVSVPCDSPFFPLDLVARLSDALEKHQADISIATSEGLPQPVFCLVRRDCAAQLHAFMRDGGRKIGAWYKTLRYVEVAFPDPSIAFTNINTLADLSRLDSGPTLDD